MADSIVIDNRVTVPAVAVRVTAVRASGPGGQNVNKVSSKVDVRVDLAEVTGLDEGARARLMVRVRNLLDADGLLQVKSQRTRDRERNLADACEKIRALIRAAMIAPIPRRPTRPTRSSVRARLTDKRRTSARKQGRTVRAED